MENYRKDSQKELFEGYTTVKKRNPQNANWLWLKDRVILKLTIENSLLLLIGFILVTAISFSLGVEKGKNALLVSRKMPAQALVQTAREKQDVSGEQQTERRSRAPAQAGQEEDQNYTIQAITYVSPDQANREIETLKNKGYQSYMSKSGKYYVVYVGLYLSEEEAQNNLKDLKLTYRDSFIKKISRRNDS